MNMTPRAIIDDFYKRYHKRAGVIDIHQEGRTICLFVDGDRFKIPMTNAYWGLPVRIYDVRALLDDSMKMLYRIRDEKVDLEDPDNKQFCDLFVVGAAICKEILAPKEPASKVKPESKDVQVV